MCHVMLASFSYNSISNYLGKGREKCHYVGKRRGNYNCHYHEKSRDYHHYLGKGRDNCHCLRKSQELQLLYAKNTKRMS